MDHEPPAERVLERLSVSAGSNGNVASVRMTENQSGASSSFRLPDNDLLERFDMARGKIGRTRPPVPPEVSARAAGHMQALAGALAEAVPAESRKRIEGARGLAVIEMTIDAVLEKYPWELIAGPGGLGYVGNVVVCRRARTSFKPKRWTSAILLAGSEAIMSGSAYARDELTLITEALEEVSLVTVHCEPHLVVGALRGLLDRHQPAVFHLAAHGTRNSLQIQNARGPTLEDLSISPEVLAAELESSQVKAAVLSCCDSAGPRSSGDRPAACQIAEQTGATVIGMAGKIHPYAAAVFGKTFHAMLASGKSAAEAYFQSVGAIRALEDYGLMWSMPVMYSSDADVIPFPSSTPERALLTFQQAEQQLNLLNGELARLAGMRDCTPEEWEKRAADPTIRLRGVAEYLATMPEAVPAADRARVLERQGLEMACEALSDWLQASARTLFQLGSPDALERGKARADLRLRRLQLDRVLMNLRFAFDAIA